MAFIKIKSSNNEAILSTLMKNTKIKQGQTSSQFINRHYAKSNILKRSVLALSLSLVFTTQVSWANEHQHYDASAESYDAAAGAVSISESTEEQEETYEHLRPEIERLFPAYVRIGEDDILYQEYVNQLEERQSKLQYFNRLQWLLNDYLELRDQQKFRKLDPNQSKLDALVYPQLKQIYDEIKSIDEDLAPYLKWNKVLLDTLVQDQPFPAYDEQQFNQLERGVNQLEYKYSNNREKLDKIIVLIDEYNELLEAHSSLASKRALKQHHENVTSLSIYSSRIAHFLKKQEETARFIPGARSEIDLDEAEKVTPERLKKFEHFKQSEENKKRVQSIVGSLPMRVSDEEGYTQKYSDDFYTLADQVYKCAPSWRGETISQDDLRYMSMTRAAFNSLCIKTKQQANQYLKNNVLLESVPERLFTLPNLNYFLDFKRYGQDLYYTETEKNALYRFSLKTGEEELIYQHQLPVDDSGCDHNMCRGVGATDVVLSKDQKYAYVASLDYDQVSVIDLQTKQLIKTFNVERYPRKLLLDEKGEYLYVYNGVANSVSRIQLKNEKIETVQLPEAYQQHFCREIGMKFSNDGEIQILGDWPIDPYIYLNPKTLELYAHQINIPYPVEYSTGAFTHIVRTKVDDEHEFAVYDTRLAKITAQVRLNYEPEQQDEEDYTYGRYAYNPVLMGWLNDKQLYFVDRAQNEEMRGLSAVLLNDEGELVPQYFFHLFDADDNQTIAFKLPARPNKIEQLDQQRILVTFDEFESELDLAIKAASDENFSAQKKMAIYDLKDATLQQISERNLKKSGAKVELKTQKIDFD